MKEISDKLKGELAHVLCDMQSCGERGDYPRCYLDIYKNCSFYKLVEICEEHIRKNPLRPIN